MVIDDRSPEWEAEPADFGGHLIRHRHGDLLAVCYVYSNPERVWAECTMCGAERDLPERESARRSY